MAIIATVAKAVAKKTNIEKTKMVTKKGKVGLLWGETFALSLPSPHL